MPKIIAFVSTRRIPEQDVTAPDVAHALEDRVKARPPDALDDRNPRQQPDRDQGRGEGRDVEAVRAREAEGGDEDSADRGPAT